MKQKQTTQIFYILYVQNIELIPLYLYLLASHLPLCNINVFVQTNHVDLNTIHFRVYKSLQTSDELHEVIKSLFSNVIKSVIKPGFPGPVLIYKMF